MARHGSALERLERLKINLNMDSSRGKIYYAFSRLLIADTFG